MAKSSGRRSGGRKTKKSGGSGRVPVKVLAAIAGAVCLIGIIAIIVTSIRENTVSAGHEDAAASSASGAEEGGERQAGSGRAAKSAEDIEISHYADIVIKDYGTVTAALDESAAPRTVANFVKLAREGFYDGLTFHRIMDGFMIQGGDPLGNGTGGSEETIFGEFSDNGFENNFSHTRGAVSMARSQDPNSASSQFFIVQSDSTFLDGQYAAFGYVTEGMEFVDQIAKDAEPTDDNGTIEKDRQPVIESITIREA